MKNKSILLISAFMSSISFATHIMEQEHPKHPYKSTDFEDVIEKYSRKINNEYDAYELIKLISTGVGTVGKYSFNGIGPIGTYEEHDKAFKLLQDIGNMYGSGFYIPYGLNYDFVRTALNYGALNKWFEENKGLSEKRNEEDRKLKNDFKKLEEVFDKKNKRDAFNAINGFETEESKYKKKLASMREEELFEECDKEIKDNVLKEGIIFAKNALNNVSWGFNRANNYGLNPPVGLNGASHVASSDSINPAQFKIMFLVFASNLLHSHESQFPINTYVDKIKKYKQAENLENLGLYDPQNLSFKEKAILTRVLQLLRRNNGDIGLELTNQFNTELAISIVKEYKNLSFLEKEFSEKDIEETRTWIEHFASRKDGETVIFLLNLFEQKEKSLDKNFVIKIIRNNFDNFDNRFLNKIINTLKVKFKIDWDEVLYDVMGNVLSNVRIDRFALYLLENPNPLSYAKKEKIKIFFNELSSILINSNKTEYPNSFTCTSDKYDIGTLSITDVIDFVKAIQNILKLGLFDKQTAKEKIHIIMQKCHDLSINCDSVTRIFEAKDDKRLYIFSDDDLKTLFSNNSLPFNLNTTDNAQGLRADFHASLRSHIERKRPWLRRFLIEEDARNSGQNAQNRPHYWGESEAVMNINTTTVVSEIEKMFPANKTLESAKTIVYEKLEKSAYCSTKIKLDDAVSTFNQEEKEYIKDKISKLESEREKAYTVDGDHTQAILDQVFVLERQLKNYMRSSIKLEEYIQAIINKTRILTQLARLKEKTPLIVSVIENTWEKEKNAKGEEIPLKENYEPFFMGLYQGAVSNPRGVDKNNPDRIDQVCQIYLFLSTALEAYVSDLLNTFNLVANATVDLSNAELDCANNLKKMFLNKQRMLEIIAQNDPINTLTNELGVTSLQNTKFKENAIKAIEGMIRWYKRIHGDQVLLNEISAKENEDNQLKKELDPLMGKISYAFTTEEDAKDSINQVFELLKPKISDGIRLLVSEDPIAKINEIRNIVHNEFKYFGMNYLVQNPNYYENIVESNITSLLKELKIEKYTKKQMEEMKKEKYELTEFVKGMLESKSNPGEKKLITWLDVYKNDNSAAINEIVRSYNELYEPNISEADVKLIIDGLDWE